MPELYVVSKLLVDNINPRRLIERAQAMFHLVKRAVETDSTGLATIFITQQSNPRVDLPGVEIPRHALTDPTSRIKSREQLEIVKTAQFPSFI